MNGYEWSLSCINVWSILVHSQFSNGYKKSVFSNRFLIFPSNQGGFVVPFWKSPFCNRYVMFVSLLVKQGVYCIKSY